MDKFILPSANSSLIIPKSGKQPAYCEEEESTQEAGNRNDQSGECFTLKFPIVVKVKRFRGQITQTGRRRQQGNGDIPKFQFDLFRKS